MRYNQGHRLASLCAYAIGALTISAGIYFADPAAAQQAPVQEPAAAAPNDPSPDALPGGAMPAAGESDAQQQAEPAQPQDGGSAEQSPQAPSQDSRSEPAQDGASDAEALSPPEATDAQGDPASSAEPAATEAGTSDVADDASEVPSPPPAVVAESKNASLPHDLSPWGMFLAADVIVKGVMIGLAVASFVTWTVWFAKAFELWSAKRRVRRAAARIRASSTLSEAAEAVSRLRGTAPHLVREAIAELEASHALIDSAFDAGIKERVTSRLSSAEASAGRRLTRGTGVLATIGATAPFVGLFGTVWGIMNSFIGISEAQTTNLAVVAPGIAEALLATAIGLVAAIPAVIIYNAFARSIAGYRLELANTSAIVERLVSRELDFRKLSRSAPYARAAE